MIRSRKELNFYLKEDRKANFMSNCSFLKYILKLISGSESAHVYRYLKCLRRCEYYWGGQNKLMYILYKVKLHRLGFKYNIRIPINVCGYGLTIYHLAGGGGCFVNALKDGNYCKLQTGVLLGNTHHKEENKPIIGNNVSLGPGAKVLGKIVVGDNVVIGANAVVTKDVPSNCMVGGVPAKLIKKL